MRRSSLNHEPDSTLAVTKTCPKDGVHLSIPPGPYDFRDFFTSYSLGAQRRVSGTVTFQTGGFFSGDITAVDPRFRSGRIEITPQLSVEPGVSVNHVDLPEGVFSRLSEWPNRDHAAALGRARRVRQPRRSSGGGVHGDGGVWACRSGR